jgi:hypothetical protein
MSLSFVIYSEKDVLISRHTVANSTEKWAVVKAAKKEHGRIKVCDKEMEKDRPENLPHNMSAEVEIKITLQLDADAPHTPDELKRAAKQAVTNALQFAYDNGFTHDLADDVSIGVADVEVVDVTTGCVRCGSDLDPAGECVDCTCPFSNHKQDCPAGWTGHPEHKAGRCICKGQP